MHQMTFNGFSPSSIQPPFFTQGFLFHSSGDDNHHHLSSFLSSAPWENSQDFGGAIEVWKEDMVACGGGEEELSDDSFQPGEKKRRLNNVQVRTLERNFELGSKLEPERKLQLAAALGLQPRQIAIWFQNRRARWKTKQLEKDYEMLRREYDIAKSQNDALQTQNTKLQSELFVLKGGEGDMAINLKKETEGTSIIGIENCSDFNLDISDRPVTLNQSPQSFPIYNAATEMSKVTKDEKGGDVSCGGGGNDENVCGIFGAVVDEPNSFWPWMER